MNLLWIYFDNGLDENGNKKTFKGIYPSEKGYLFDNRFNVGFDKNNKKIFIEENDKFVKLYNNALTSVSCIVGKNGSGKTTFFELIITNVSWGMNKGQPDFMISLYYEIKENDINFFLQVYRGNAKTNNFKLFFKKNYEQEFQEIDYLQQTNDSPYSTNMIPNNVKFIFHSLSPFDKIFYSIAEPLKDNTNRIKHFKDKMDYIGIQRMFSDDYKYEIKTLANFLFMFKNEYFKESFIKSLNFEFESMDVNINNEIYEAIIDKNKDFFDELEEMLNKLNTNKKVNEFKNLGKFIELNKDEQLKFFKYLFEDIKYELGNKNEKLLWLLILNNIIFNKFINNFYLKNLENFFEILNLSSCIKDDKIDFNCIKKSFLSIRYKKRAFFEENIDEKLYLLQELDIFEFVNKDLNEIEFDELQNFLQLVRFLRNKDFIDFKIYLKKGNEIINYFYLSSGEKTLISYFANIVASIHKFTPLENKTFIILIDEVELHLHPEWQRRFIYYMNNFFRENGFNIKFQFIIATHSPFILSDIVDEQIIYIKDKSDLDINTFGANIYDIFEKGFFLENSIGKYSEEMIKAISLILSFYQALYLADNKNNIILLREILNRWYKTKNGRLSEEKLKTQDKYFIKSIKRCNLKVLGKVFEINKLDFKKFENLFFEKNELSKSILNYINIIGDDVVRNHLLAIYENIKDYIYENK